MSESGHDSNQQQPPTKRNIGPVLCGTLVTGDLELIINAYQGWLDMAVSEQGVLPEALASGWAMPSLAGQRYALLTSRSGASWLRVIEQPGCAPAEPVASLGWLSLEVLVEDVFKLAERLRESPFRFIGEPAKLDVSDSITACQVVGPAGEVLYLTAVASPVPPFELPVATAFVDRLFIPVMAVPERASAMHYYETADNFKALAFDTKVTVINRSLGKPIERRIPVCTLQLDHESLIEIDEVSEFPARAVLPSGLVAGIAVVSFLVDSFEQIPGQPLAPVFTLDDGFYQGRRAALYRGPAGELVEFIER
ncbi:hypothetical protein [Halioxenophilus sp. WMMB6]|uniref:hypothetical protein n=1 Tax=Halioxenophilus sp. WMMB6 TaxID=3073815 RepID=UPI00295EEA4B|nr:hypothetical protein [Halioxenophilus sp. WMMB6]